MLAWLLMLIVSTASLFSEEFSKHIETCRSELSTLTHHNRQVLQQFDHLSEDWHKYYLLKRSEFNVTPLLEAVTFAAKKHEGQTRDDVAKTPYIIHPLTVCRILWEEGKIRSHNVLIAALLHDTLEDTNTTAEEVENRFGKRVKETVEELTDDPKLPPEEQKKKQVEHAHSLSWNAQTVKLADRLANIRDLRAAPPQWTKDSVIRYLDWGVQLLDALQGTNEPLERALQKELLIHQSQLGIERVS